MGCFPKNKDEQGLLIRVYGIGTELFIDRNAEKETMKILAKAGLGNIKFVYNKSEGESYYAV